MSFDPHAVARLAEMQHGKVASAQLAALGMSPSSIRYRVSKGVLIRDRRGVYAVGHVPDTPESRWSGAVLAAGPDAALSHLAAARHWQLLPWDPDRIDITRPRQARTLEGVTCHTSSLDGEVTVHRGIRVTNSMRTIADCAQVLRAEQVARLLREARHLGYFDSKELERYASRQLARHGAPCLRAALDQCAGGGAGFRSRLERAVRDVLVARGAPDPHINVLYSTDIGAVEVDQSWPGLNVCLEIDGPTHEDSAQQRTDERCRAALRRAGWNVCVVHHADFAADQVAATDQVMAALRHPITTNV